MKLSTGISLLGLGLGVAGFAVSNQGCSSDDTPSGGGAKVGQPPERPSGAAPSDTPARNFALYSLSLGEADRSGATNPNAWKKYGYNLDGVVSTKSSTDVCKLAPGASSATQEDGDNGIDNSFAIQLQHDSQRGVRRGMLWAEIQRPQIVLFARVLRKVRSWW